MRAALSLFVVALSVAALVVLAQNAAPRAHAGDSATAQDLMILDRDSAELVVSVTRTLTAEDIDIGAFTVDLVETDFLDSVFDSKLGLVPIGAEEGETVTVEVKFTLKCTNNKIEGLDLQEHTFELEIDGTDIGTVTVACVGDAMVEFNPDPLEIPEGEEAKVTATVTKILTLLEANSRTINLRLQEKDEDTHLGHTPNDQVKLPGKWKDGQKATFSWRFALECKNNEVKGIESTGKEEATIAIEFTEGGADYGDGTVRCIPPKTSSLPSGGSHPSDVFVDEETGLAYALNAFDGAIGVFAGDEQVDTLQLPCPYAPAGASSAQPAGFNCVYQSLRLHYFPQQVGFAIYAADFQAAWIVAMFFGDFASGSAVAGGPDSVTAIPVGDGPADIEYDPVGDRLHVANSGDGTVSVINPDPGVVEDTIATGGSPGQIAIDSANGTAYVTDFTGDQVIVIDTATYAVTGTLPAGNGPDGIVFDPDTGELYVTNYIDNTLSIIETAQPASGTASPPATVPTGAGPIEVDVNPLTDRIFVANGIEDTVTMIDRTSREIVATVPVGLTPDDVTVDRQDGLVYVANHDVNTLTLIENPSPFSERLWGDLDCNNVIDQQDVLAGLLTVGALATVVPASCLAAGEPVDVLDYGEMIWADVNCDGFVDLLDVIAILRRVAGLDDAPPAGCPGYEFVSVF